MHKFNQLQKLEYIFITYQKRFLNGKKIINNKIKGKSNFFVEINPSEEEIVLEEIWRKRQNKKTLIFNLWSFIILGSKGNNTFN